MTSQPGEDELQVSASLLVDRCVGENLDQLSTLDMRGDGILRVLYGAARALHSSPLTLTAARALMGCLETGSAALMLTGFLAPKPFPETDGLIGSVVLAAALERACAALPAVVAEPAATSALSAAPRGAGLHVIPPLPNRVEDPHATGELLFS